MSDKKVTVQQLKNKIKRFIEKRDWEQFHSPKNLSMSIAIEAAELMEHFQWLSIEESKKRLSKKDKKIQVEEELADIAIYLLDFCNIFKIDLHKIVEKKLAKNNKKYPIKLFKGKSDKYSEI